RQAPGGAPKELLDRPVGKDCGRRRILDGRNCIGELSVATICRDTAQSDRADRGSRCAAQGVPCLRAYLLGERDRFAEIGFGRRGLSLFQSQLASNPEGFGAEAEFLWVRLQRFFNRGERIADRAIERLRASPMQSI